MDCVTVSLPGEDSATLRVGSARVAKSADAKDLKSFSRQRECGFNSRPGHQSPDFGPEVLLFQCYPSNCPSVTALRLLTSVRQDAGTEHRIMVAMYFRAPLLAVALLLASTVV